MTFGLPGKLSARHPMQKALPNDIGGMARKAVPPTSSPSAPSPPTSVCDRTVRNWIRRGDLPSYKLGAARRIDPADVENFLARHRD